MKWKKALCADCIFKAVCLNNNLCTLQKNNSDIGIEKQNNNNEKANSPPLLLKNLKKLKPHRVKYSVNMYMPAGCYGLENTAACKEEILLCLAVTTKIMSL